ncbi:MAG: ABC transporter ATP-binding protein [Thermodesulfovibrionales bacterium]|nr:ABC transporter ATP-binding protein [Thermodesulfovibrionales bacterium]
MTQQALCILTDIKKTYHVGEINVEVLKGINLEINRGEFIAVMGASGSGKTTLLNIIGCLDRPSSGRYFLAGKEVSSLSDEELSDIRNRHIGFVFQNFYLLPYATVLENVLLPTLYRSSGNPLDAKEILRLVGLSDRAKFKPNQLSGGQQQRVAIARALINDPDLLLADEPTGQLDSSTAKDIMTILKELNNRGKTIILVTHDNNIASYAERIIYMKDGLIVEEISASV